MKRSAPHALFTWLFSLLLRQRDKESILGDLIEEHTLLASSLSPRDASRWYREQLFRSTVTVIWANIRRGSWLKTLGAAGIGYLAMVQLASTSDFLVIKFLFTANFFSATHGYVLNLLILSAMFPSMVLGGYIAACMRSGAPVALAVISAISGVATLLALNGDHRPWMQVVLTALPGSRLWPVDDCAVGKRLGETQY